MTMQGRNEVELEGTVQDAPVWSHENHGTAFYLLSLAVPRLSGQRDILPVLVRQPLLDGFRKSVLPPSPGLPLYTGQSIQPAPSIPPMPPGPSTHPGQPGQSIPPGLPVYPGTAVQTGQPLRVTGQLRSFNNRSGVGRRLVLTVFARELSHGENASTNSILLSGCLCKPPVFRRTPLGRSICDLMLAVPRRCGRADYLPIIAWGQLAASASSLSAGSPLSLEGRIQSRTYRKVTENGVQERTAYEVSVMRFLDGGGEPRTRPPRD